MLNCMQDSDLVQMTLHSLSVYYNPNWNILLKEVDCGGTGTNCFALLRMWVVLPSHWRWCMCPESHCWHCTTQSVFCIGQPSQPICQIPNKPRRYRADQVQVLWDRENAKYHWCDRLHSCPHPSTLWEGMGVCEQERTTQHQCATCGECRPHHN